MKKFLKYLADFMVWVLACALLFQGILSLYGIRREYPTVEWDLISVIFGIVCGGFFYYDREMNG